MPAEQPSNPQHHEPELYNSRIVHNWLEFLGEKHPGLDLGGLLKVADIKGNQVDDPKQWFTQEQIDRFHAYIEARIEDPALPRMAGRFVVYKKRPNVLQQYAFGFFDPLAAYVGLKRIMPRVTRGAHIQINKLAANRVEIVNWPTDGTQEKPFQCDNRIGIYEAIGRLFTKNFAKVEHTECWHKGGQVCRYLVSWPDLAQHRWRLFRNCLAVLALPVCGAMVLSGANMLALYTALAAAMGLVMLHCKASQVEKKNLSAIIEQQGSAARRLFKEIGIRHNTAVLIQEIGNLSPKTVTVDQVLEKVAQAIKKRLALDRVVLIYEDCREQETPNLAYCGYGSNEVGIFLEAWQARHQPKGGLMSRLFKDREAIIINRQAEQGEASESEQYRFIQSIGAAAFIGIPIVFEKNLVGLMAVDTTQSSREVSAIDMRLLMGVASQLAVQVNAVTAYGKLKKSEAQYRLMADHVSDVIWMLDIETLCFTFASPSAERLFGYTPDEMKAITLDQLLAPKSMAMATEAIVDELEKENNPGADPLRSRTLELEHVCKDGHLVWVEITARFVRDEKGKAVQILGVSRDITQRVEANKAKDLLQDQLQRAQKMEALGTLAGGVAHDLNNILAGLVSYPDLLLLELPEDSSLRKPVKTILKSGQRAAAIVQDLLTLARRGVIVTKAVNLNRIIKEYLDSPEFGELIAYHPRCEISQRLADDLPVIEGSPVHLSKTVMNLVANAAEAMPNGGIIDIVTERRVVTKAIEGYERVAPGEYVVFRVKDEGVGIESRDLQHIFEPFYTKKIMGRSGTGLGMAVVWGTVKDTNGFIDVVTRKGHGSMFSLYFPIAYDQVESRDQKESWEAYAGNGETVLVVDDIADQREIAAAILTELGYRVNTVDSGEAAAAYVQSHKVDLVILDMIMDPGMDGLDAYRHILTHHPRQKAIIATGYSETDRVIEVQRLGAAACIKKPYTIESFGLAVRKVLDSD